MLVGAPSRVRTTGRAHPALAGLVGVSLAEFARQYWSRQPLVSTADQLSGDLAALLGPAGVDELVSTRAIRVPFLRVAKEGRTLGDAEFTQGGGVGAAVSDQVSDDKLLRLFGDGATIVLQGLHRSWEPVMHLSQGLSGELGHPVQANAYVTPSQNRGFDDHYDVHDVFVVQTSGEKRWRLHPPVHEAPLRDEPWSDRRAQVEAAARQRPSHEFTLRPGDCLYLPRGWLHSATALGGVSIHLTIGVHVWTRRHLADELMALALGTASADPALRSSLPVGLDVGSPGDIAEDLELARSALIAALEAADPAQVAAALDRRSRSAVRAAPIGPLAQLEAAQALEPGTCLRLRSHLAARLVSQPDDSVRLVTRAGSVPLTPAEAGGLRVLLGGDALPARDIGLELAGRLLRAGVLVPDGLAAQGGTSTQ